jgi:hypothetical protein
MTMLPIDSQAFIDLIPAVRQSPGHTMRCTYDEPADVVSRCLARTEPRMARRSGEPLGRI